MLKGIKIGGATLNQTPLDWENNLNNILKAIDLAKSESIEILCLQELCLPGYGCEDMFLADWVFEKSLSILVEKIIPATSGITVCVGLPLKIESQAYNCAALISNKKWIGIYPKVFLAHAGVYYEPRWFKAWVPGKLGLFKTKNHSVNVGIGPFFTEKGFRIGFEICEDAWQNENRVVKTCYQNAPPDFILNPSASHFEFGKSEKRIQIVKEGSRLIEGTYLYANALGNESGRLIFDGEILIAEQGKLVAANRHFSFQDVNLISYTTGSCLQNIDFQIEEKEEAFKQSVGLGLFDYMRKSKSRGFILSLSGGADSSACAVLVNEMVKSGISELGKEAFVKKSGLPVSGEFCENELIEKMLACAYQSTENSSNATKQAAKSLASEIGCAFYEWSVNEIVEGFKSLFAQKTGQQLSWEKDDLLLQNIQSRARSPMIWMLANARNALLLTTSNRSEGAVGYCTMDGDTSGGLAPISGVDKHFIKNWLLWAEKNLGYAALKLVNEQEPTAELRPLTQNQTDEKDLMPYRLMTAIEECMLNQKMDIQQTYEALKTSGFESEDLEKNIQKFATHWSRTQWKRDRLAPGFHLDTFSVDSRGWFRFPILNGGLG